MGFVGVDTVYADGTTIVVVNAGDTSEISIDFQRIGFIDSFSYVESSYIPEEAPHPDFNWVLITRDDSIQNDWLIDLLLIAQISPWRMNKARAPPWKQPTIILI